MHELVLPHAPPLLHLLHHDALVHPGFLMLWRSTRPAWGAWPEGHNPPTPPWFPLQNPLLYKTPPPVTEPSAVHGPLARYTWGGRRAANLLPLRVCELYIPRIRGRTGRPGNAWGPAGTPRTLHRIHGQHHVPLSWPICCRGILSEGRPRRVPPLIMKTVQSIPLAALKRARPTPSGGARPSKKKQLLYMEPRAPHPQVHDQLVQAAAVLAAPAAGVAQGEGEALLSGEGPGPKPRRSVP